METSVGPGFHSEQYQDTQRRVCQSIPLAMACMREGCSVLCEAGFCYTIVKTRENQKTNTYSNRPAAKTTIAQEKMSKITVGKIMLRENSTAQQQSPKNYW